ncbi:Pr6Pr family membrane protein [Sphingopyxis panaciterrae]
MGKGARTLYGIAALAAWGALVLQLSLSLSVAPEAGQSVAAALWRFLGFFTVLTNGFVAVVATAVVLAPHHRLASTRMRFMALVSIAIVGIVYSLALRHIWDPQGWQAVADHALHDAVPLLFILAWLVAPHGGLGWRNIGWGVVPGLLYVIYAFARGAIDGWYAYYFLDPRALGWPALFGNVAAILAGVLIVALLFVAIDKLLATRRAE